MRRNFLILHNESNIRELPVGDPPLHILQNCARRQIRGPFIDQKVMKIIKPAVSIIAPKNKELFLQHHPHVAEATRRRPACFVVHDGPFLVLDFELVKIGARVAGGAAEEEDGIARVY